MCIREKKSYCTYLTFCLLYIFFPFAASFRKLGLPPHLIIMAHLPPADIQARREAATQDILSEWQGAKWVAIQCPCRIDCGCMPLNEVLRIVLPNYLYAGQLDYFFVTQPFQATYGFRVRWHCDECEDEMACGFPLGM